MKTLHHICIQTNKYEASLAFYCDILEFKIVKETKNFHERTYNTWLKLDSLMIELQTNKAGETLKPFNKNSMGLVHFCLLVEDIDKEYKRIISLGYSHFKPKNETDIYEVEGGRLMKLIAPEGTIIEIRDNKDI